MRLPPRLALLLLPLAGLAHAADQVPIVPAGADNRFELALDPKTKIRGLTPAQVTQFRQRVDALTGYLRTLSAVTQPPAPLCMRLSSWLDLGADPLRGAQANVYAHYPVAFEKGKCTRVTGDGVTFTVNQDYPLFDNRYRVSGIPDSEYFRIPVTGQQGRIVRLKGYGVVLTREGKLPWRPADRKQFLSRQADVIAADLERAEQGDRDMNALLLKQTGKPYAPRPAELRSRAAQRALLERTRAELAAGVRGEPVCLNEVHQVAGPGCSPDNIVMERNPDYWKGKAPDRIGLIVVWTGQESKWEAKDKEAMRIGVFHAVDLQKLLALVEP